MIYFPFLPCYAKSADGRPSKLKPIAALMEHQGRILIIIIFWRSRLQLLLDHFFLVLLFLGRWRV